MSSKVKKSSVLFVGLVLSLSAAMLVNWYYTKPSKAVSGGTPTTTEAVSQNLGDAQFVNAKPEEEYFSKAQLERDKSKEEAKKMLTELLENNEIDDASKQESRKAYERLANNIKLESDIETLIKAKCSSDVIVCLSDTAEVIVKKGVINDTLSVQIKDIITSKTDISEEKITIIEAK